MRKIFCDNSGKHIEAGQPYVILSVGIAPGGAPDNDAQNKLNALVTETQELTFASVRDAGEYITKNAKRFSAQ